MSSVTFLCNMFNVISSLEPTDFGQFLPLLRALEKEEIIILL